MNRFPSAVSRVMLMLVGVLLAAGSVRAQTTPTPLLNAAGTYLRTVRGVLLDGLDEVRVALPDLQVGDMVYAQASGPTITPLLSLADTRQTMRAVLADNPDGAHTVYLQYRVLQAGDYVLMLVSPAAGGAYELHYGVNMPVLSASPNDSRSVAPAADPVYTLAAGIPLQRFSGALDSKQTLTVQVPPLQAGDTLSATASGSEWVLTVQDARDTVVARSDAGVLAYVSAEDGQLTLVLTALDAGNFSLTVGVNIPAALLEMGAGEATPRGSQFALARGVTEALGGRLIDRDDIALLTLHDVLPGDTLSVQVTGLAALRPVVLLFSPALRSIVTTASSDRDHQASLAFTVDQGGDYTVVIYTEGNSGGGFRIVAGINDPAIVTAGPPSGVAAAFDCASVTDNERPVLSGAETTIAATNTLVHYTRFGADATTDAYASALSEAVEDSLAIQFGRLGWRKPPSDCGLGGDDRLDIYVMDIRSGAIGFARPEDRVGDNPNTPATELDSAFSYLVIENDMDFLANAGAEYDISALDLMRVTAAHEVHHNIQFGDDTRESYYGFYESGAMWIETLVYPQITDAYLYDALFLNPDLCIGSRADADGLRIYAEWVMIDSLTRDLGAAAYQALWESLATRDNMSGFYSGLELLGTNVETVVRHMAIRNLLLDYPHGERFITTISPAGEIRGTGTFNADDHGVQQQGVDYLKVLPGIWQFDVRSGRNIQLSLVGVDRASATATSYTLGTAGTVDTTPFDAAWLIVQNTTRHQRVEDCYFTRYAISVRDGHDQPPTPPDPDEWDATHYWEHHP